MASSIRESATSSPTAGERGALGEALHGIPRPSAGESEWRRAWFQLRRHRLAMVGLWVLVLLVLLSVLAPLSPYDPNKTSLRERFQPPNHSHWMGTDELGRDVFTRVLYGGRISLAVGFVVALLGVGLGGLIGATAAYIGGAFDEVTMRIVDVVRSLPALAVLIVLAQVLRLQLGIKGGFWNIVLILVAFSWTGVARIVRSVVLSIQAQDFVLAARCVGVPRHRIVLQHLLPNAMAPMIVATTLGAGAAINVESALSFLGLGIQPPTPSWGNLLFNAQTYLWNNPWIAIFPGVFIFVTLLSLNFLGDGLRDALDPRLRQGV
ncbi:MAG TPA: peptide ABC transporter permease [Chloroflexi bacterium]|nr:peptide ABC transporter permease [Chloroflexota bacterium]